MESIKSRHHFVDDDLIDTWMTIIGNNSRLLFLMVR